MRMTATYTCERCEDQSPDVGDMIRQPDDTTLCVACHNEPRVDPVYHRMAQDGFAWPGGYEMYFITDDSGVLCSPCVVQEWEATIKDTHPTSGWYIVGYGYQGQSDGEVRCDHCNRIVQEDDEEDEPLEDEDWTSKVLGA